MDIKNSKIPKIKGHPRLNWIGKKSVDIDTHYPTQLIETFNGNQKEPKLNFQQLEKDWYHLLFHGDNKEVIIQLLDHGFRGKIDLIYIDPPFDSQSDYIRKIELRGDENKIIEQKQYFDIWKNDDYLQFIYERLILPKELLSDRGSIYLHCDWHRSHHLRCLLDEVFGEENFVNEISWGYKTGGISTRFFAKKHDTLFFYSKTKKTIFNLQYYLSKQKYKYGFGKKHGYELIEKNGNFYKKAICRDFWDDIDHLGTQGLPKDARTGYPTQKPEALLERIIKASSNEDSIVFDCFMGSGTTQAVAQRLGRRWIGSDINKGAIHTTSKRLQNIIQEEEKMISKFAYFKVNDLSQEKFPIDEPCKAKIHFDKEKGMIEIKDFVSPTIIKRLYHDRGTSTPEIQEFREMIDCILIDNAYNEKTFNIVYSDVPKKRKELIKGKYQITVKGKIAVKIIDMLGEEVVVVGE